MLELLTRETSPSAWSCRTLLNWSSGSPALRRESPSTRPPKKCEQQSTFSGSFSISPFINWPGSQTAETKDQPLVAAKVFSPRSQQAFRPAQMLAAICILPFFSVKVQPQGHFYLYSTSTHIHRNTNKSQSTPLVAAKAYFTSIKRLTPVKEVPPPFYLYNCTVSLQTYNCITEGSHACMHPE